MNIWAHYTKSNSPSTQKNVNYAEDFSAEHKVPIVKMSNNNMGNLYYISHPFSITVLTLNDNRILVFIVELESSWAFAQKSWGPLGTKSRFPSTSVQRFV